MADEAKAMATLVANVERQTGRTLAQLGAALRASGFTKHGELRRFLMDTHGLGYGQANAVVHLALKTDGGSVHAGKAEGDVLGAIYADRKAALRPIHDALLAFLGTLGAFDAAPKKDYVSYRRKKQFVMIGPKTATAVEVGLAAKQLPTHARLKEMPPKSMCRYTTRLSSVAEIDGTLKGWIRAAYDEAG